MLPTQIFGSSRFVAANLVTFVVYAALGGVSFLLVVYLQVGLGYSAIGAGAATLPVTVLMLTLSPRAGALAARVGPRRPLTAGAVLLATGMVLMSRIAPGRSYPDTVLPAVAVFGLGLAATVAPVTATALGAVDPRWAGTASGVNTAVARIAGLLAVAVLPVAAGLGGRNYRQPGPLTHGFHLAMLVTAALALLGAVLAATTLPATVMDGPDRGTPSAASPGEVP